MSVRVIAPRSTVLFFWMGIVVVPLFACSNNTSGLGNRPKDASSTDGIARSGGVDAGATATGGVLAATGGSRTGGVPGAGGTQTGGTSSGGAAVSGGSPNTGGILSGGMARTGGVVPTGGSATGGLGAGGIQRTGGVVSTGGTGAGGGVAVDGGVDAVSRPDAREAGKVPCENANSLLECDARPECHAVFVDRNTCDCMTPGCCASYSGCAEGGTAACTGNPTCKMATPNCTGPYVVAYTGTCYEGCVRQTACQPMDAGVKEVGLVTPLDGGADLPPLVVCQSGNPCKPNEIVVRMESTTVPGTSCVCLPNPCGSSFPDCACAESVCTPYGATCVAYMPGSGHLVCRH